MNRYRIRLHRPFFDASEHRAAARALAAESIVGNGSHGEALERRMARDLGVRHVFLTTSGTHALELAMAGVALSRGDEVILPSFTFTSVANCVMRQGARPVFADIGADDLNISPEEVERRVSRKTKAVIAVHYAGVPCDMDSILSLARKQGLRVVEDAAHALGGRYGSAPLGTIGDVGCFSFHATKNLTCGEGGALVTDSAEIARRAELFREKGTNRAAWVRGETSKYTWVSDGSSFVLSDVLAAILVEQWRKRREIQNKRAALFHRYLDALADLQRDGACRLPKLPERGLSAYHIFFVLLPDVRLRDKCLERLRASGIECAFHFIPLHNSPFARKTLGCRDRLPVTESVADRLLRLPLHPSLSERDVDIVCDRFRRALQR